MSRTGVALLESSDTKRELGLRAHKQFDFSSTVASRANAILSSANKGAASRSTGVILPFRCTATVHIFKEMLKIGEGAEKSHKMIEELEKMPVYQ